ncbi:smoothelin, like [Betta splendens]|uniref:Smoothelin, like n=1 Tax=Betta splendens TaxID=158456 RepID=A0A6P7P9G8_BETSP|nr:smoothelin, like [Betta splendens]XP_040929303.1 smoothelin, like [Betta splendens]XP_040929304.1 smoothelin, like [Betta splendens]XP_055370279.1 smoothelin, like [Betta splendens]XP_055370280.1 smoothelin, like [Betta splendens]XP_055370281.1 smoothelin, like [Betta splendens]XP_055370282.1 smoothelin, like [Betta splendens]XP_055370283.1 smoothelin, like [Betta splendens]XP_055370284.1 smoothelin, like [Betta splendens]
MEAPALADMGDLCHPRPPSPEGETVCGALARYESTLRDAIREIHVDVSAFKLGMERRLEDAANLSGPLGRAVAQLQQENRQLRNQLEALTRQVELLSGAGLLNNNHDHIRNHKNHLNDIQENHEEVKEVVHARAQAQSQAHLHIQTLGNQAQTYSSLSGQSGPASPPAAFSPASNPSSPPAGSRVSSMVTGPVSSSSPSTARFSSRATFALSSKTNSTEREEPIEVDPAPTHNGHAAATEQSVFAHGKVSPPNDFPLEHTAPVAVRMPHLPITATTKTAELKGSPDSPGCPFGSGPAPATEAPAQTATSTGQSQATEESPIQPVSSAKTWTPTPIRALGSPCLHEKTNSAPVKSVSYSGLQQCERDTDAYSDRSFGPMGERRRELHRSQTLPRSIGAQARRSIFERLDPEATSSRLKPVDSKPKLKRSQSFGVSSASGIKQILLEWCRSKTIGYQNIDIQNFSSSWSDGMAFCALVHSFFPTEFDYDSLSPQDRKHNFELAFGAAELKAGCDRLIEVDDMMIMGHKPDPMCVFTYVQSLYNHLRKFE